VITHIMPKLHLPAWWPLEVAMSLSSGIVAQLVWKRFTRMVWHVAERLTGRHPLRQAT